MDPVAKKIRDIKITDRKEDFAARFAQQFLEKNRYVRGDPGSREIQPLFGWLLMELHKTSGTIEVAPGVIVSPTAGSLLIALGEAVYDLHTQLEAPTSLAAVVNAHTFVQRLAQETTMRIVAGAQIMALLSAHKSSGDKLEQLQISRNEWLGGNPIRGKIETLVKALGLDDTNSTRALFLFDQLGGKVKDGSVPYMRLEGWQKGVAAKNLWVTTVGGVPGVGGAGQKITSDVDGDDDYVTVEIDWQ